MTKKFKHKQTGQIVTQEFHPSMWRRKPYHSYTYKNPGACINTNVEARFVENSNDWEEIIDYPIGTKVRDTEFPAIIWEKVGTAPQWSSYTAYANFNFDESQIGEGKRFQLFEESKRLPNGMIPCPNCGAHMSGMRVQVKEGMIDCTACGWSSNKEQKNWRITGLTDVEGRIYKFRRNLNDNVFYLSAQDKMHGRNFLMLADLENHAAEIYSVEVLQGVGDWKTCGKRKVREAGKWIELKLKDKTDKGTIEAFQMYHAHGPERLTIKMEYLTGLLYELNEVTLMKPPLFQLPDEKGELIDIFKGDPVFRVIVNQMFKGKAYTSEIADFQTLFATKRAAQNHIDLNQKKYSKQEILDALTDVGYNLKGLYLEKFRQKLGL